MAHLINLNRCIKDLHEGEGPEVGIKEQGSASSSFFIDNFLDNTPTQSFDSGTTAIAHK